MQKLNSESRGARHQAQRALAGVLLATLAACGGPTKKAEPTGPAAPAPDAWRKQSMALLVEGYMFGGGTQPSAASWHGSGAWIAPNIAVTNAHVALRGLKITAKDDHGKTYEFTEILGVNEEADLAIIKAGDVSESHLPLVDQPAEIKDLRGTSVRVIGNTGGLGLSFYDGRITNVVGGVDDAVLLHDANTAGGASGGPLITKEGALVGVNHSSLPSLNAKAAAPSWIVKKLMDSAANRKALPLKDAFNPANLPVNWYVERAVCLKPGEVFKGVFAAVATNDLVADVTPAQNTPMGFVLLRGNNEVLAEAVITGKAQGAWTLAGKGEYVFAVVNPKDAAGPACATVKFGRINWAQRFN